jgi:ABC-type glycerol-3-phosphate transport system substrate-binding protein
MNMKKVMIMCVVLVLIAGGIWAAGSGEAEGQKTAKLKIWGWTLNRSDGASIHPISEAYMEANPGVEIELMETNWNEAYNSIILMSQSGNMPDLYQVNRNWLQDFIKMGALEDLTDRVAAAGMNDRFYEPVLGEDNGRTWIIPYLGGNSALIINRGLFNELGVKVPTTMEEIAALGKAVSNPDKNFYATAFCMSESNVTGANVCNFGPILFTFGGSYVENQKASFNNAAGVKAMQWMIDMEKNAKIATPGSITIDARRMREIMAAGDVLMTFDGAWGTPFYANYPELDIEYVQMPAAENIGTVINIACWGIAKESEVKDEAWDFLQYLYTDENLALLNKDGNMPITPTLGTLPENQTAYAGFLDTLAVSDNYFRTGSVPNETELYRLVVKAYHEAMLGKKSVQQALDDAAAEYDVLLKKFYSN